MLMFYPAEESVQCGLVDTLIYKNDVRNYLKAMVGIDKDDRMPVLGLQDMIKRKEERSQRQKWKCDCRILCLWRN